MPLNKQILAITHKLRKGKVKNRGKAKNKIRDIRSREQYLKWLSQ